MTEDNANKRLAELLEEYHRRRARGESARAEDFREAAGDDFAEFEEILRAETTLDEAMNTPDSPKFPLPFGEYTLLSELGRGAMGVVYEAIQRDLGRKVALKVLITGFDTHPVAIERFRREARACAQIRHDNIVGIYEAGECDGRHFYAMELLPGKTLGQLGRAGELPEPKKFAADIAEVADALHTLHESGIIHRDIKPGNIMVEPSGRMILADFGLARTVEAEGLTGTGENLGTPLYMSPEQLLGANDDVNARSDIYGLGATLYEVLAGHPVFQTNDMRVLMRMILKERPAPLEGVPDGLARIVMKALEKENADRYESAAAMRDDLRAFARGEAVAGRPLNSVERGVRTMRRHWIPITVVAAAIVAVVAGVALQPPEPARVTIACVPEAEVRIGGTPRGTTPLAFELDAGGHEVSLHRDGWETRRVPLRLKEGENRSIDMLLAPSDPTDAAALDELAAAFKIRMATWEELPRHRGMGNGASVLIEFPRGNVRTEDLAEFSFRLDGEFDGEGAIVFRAGDREIYRRTIGDEWPESMHTRAPLPTGVTATLAKGTEITWGFYPERGTPITASFRVVDGIPVGRLAEIDRRLEGKNPLVARQLKAQLYLNAGLAYAAFREASAIVETEPGAVKAYAVMRDALQQLELEDTDLWLELQRKTTDLPSEERRDATQR